MTANFATRRALPLLRIARPSLRKCCTSKCAVRHFSLIRAALTGRKFTTDHEWVLNNDGVGTVGITSYAQDKLGEIVYVELPEVDAEFEVGDNWGALESVKAASDLFSPVSGTVAKVNENLSDSPSMINTSPYDDGWIVQIKMSNPAELDGLMSEEQYDKFIREMDNE